MAKCERCAKSIGLFRAGVPLAHGMLCAPCAKDLGFDIKEDRYLLRYAIYPDLCEGRERYKQLQSARSTAHYEFLVHYDDEKVERYLVKYQKFWSDPDYKYEGLSIKEIKDSCRYGEKIYKYEPVDVDLEFKYEDGVLRVFLYDGEKTTDVGYAPGRKTKRIVQILSDLDPDVFAELSGGHFYQLKNNGYVEDEWSDEYKIRVRLDWSRRINLKNLDDYL